MIEGLNPLIAQQLLRALTSFQEPDSLQLPMFDGEVGWRFAGFSDFVDIDSLDTDASPVGSEDYIMTLDATDGELKKVLIDDIAAVGSSGDHGSLTGLTDDDHSQYVHNTIARVISADHEFSGNISLTGLGSLGASLITASLVVIDNATGDLYETSTAVGNPSGTVFLGYNPAGAPYFQWQGISQDIEDVVTDAASDWTIAGSWTFSDAVTINANMSFGVGDRILLDDGSATLPSLSFSAESTMGFYYAGVQSIGVAVNTSQVARFEDDRFVVVAPSLSNALVILEAGAGEAANVQASIGGSNSFVWGVDNSGDWRVYNYGTVSDEILIDGSTGLITLSNDVTITGDEFTLSGVPSQGTDAGEILYRRTSDDEVLAINPPTANSVTYFLQYNSSAGGFAWTSTVPAPDSLIDIGDVNGATVGSNDFLQWTGSQWEGVTIDPGDLGVTLGSSAFLAVTPGAPPTMDWTGITESDITDLQSYLLPSYSGNITGAWDFTATDGLSVGGAALAPTATGSQILVRDQNDGNAVKYLNAPTADSSDYFLGYNSSAGGFTWRSTIPLSGDLGDLDNVNEAGVASGNFLQYNGTGWVPSDIDPGDLGATLGSDAFLRLTPGGPPTMDWDTLAASDIAAGTFQAGTYTFPDLLIPERIALSNRGTSGVVGYTFVGDGNTGMFSPADEEVGISTGGVTAMSFAREAVRVGSDDGIVLAGNMGNGFAMMGAALEENILYSPFMFNTLANLPLETSTYNSTGGRSRSDWNQAFDGTGNHVTLPAADTLTMDTNYSTNYGQYIGVVFGSENWLPVSLTIEAYYNSTWNTVYSVASGLTETHHFAYFSSGVNAVSQVRFTFGAPAGSSVRVLHCWHFSYNETGNVWLNRGAFSQELHGDLTFSGECDFTATDGLSVSGAALAPTATGSQLLVRDQNDGDAVKYLNGPTADSTDYFLGYNSSSGGFTWRSSIPLTGDLGDLDNVDETGVVSGNFLQYDGVDWVPVDIDPGDLGSTLGSVAFLQITPGGSPTMDWVQISTSDITDLDSWAGSSSITTLGTITTGTWSGTDIGPSSIDLTADFEFAGLVAGTIDTVASQSGPGWTPTWTGANTKRAQITGNVAITVDNSSMIPGTGYAIIVHASGANRTVTWNGVDIWKGNSPTSTISSGRTTIIQLFSALDESGNERMIASVLVDNELL